MELPDNSVQLFCFLSIRTCVFGVLKNCHDLSFIRIIIFAVAPIIRPFNNIKLMIPIIDTNYPILNVTNNWLSISCNKYTCEITQISNNRTSPQKKIIVITMRDLNMGYLDLKF